ncbi:MAG: efflux RND transporter permease subunit [Candidatus Binataceae bacterium]
MGESLNTLTLGALAIAIGEVEDDAIIDVENVFRRLKENKFSQNPRPVFQVMLDASFEVVTLLLRLRKCFHGNRALYYQGPILRRSRVCRRSGRLRVSSAEMSARCGLKFCAIHATFHAP